MKNKDNVSLHDRAEFARRCAEDECRDFNEEAEREAIEEFEKGETAKFFRENAKYVTGLVVKRLEAAQKGDWTFPIRPFDAETLAQLLSASTEAPCEVREFVDNLSDEDTVAAGETGDLVQDGYVTSAATPATSMQNDLRDAMLEYATAAASYAKHIGSASLLEWAEMIDILDNREMWLFARLKSEDALRLIELEKSAANRLRFDKIIAELPPFKPAKKRAKK